MFFCCFQCLFSLGFSKSSSKRRQNNDKNLLLLFYIEWMLLNFVFRLIYRRESEHFLKCLLQRQRWIEEKVPNENCNGEDDFFFEYVNTHHFTKWTGNKINGNNNNNICLAIKKTQLPLDEYMCVFDCCIACVNRMWNNNLICAHLCAKTFITTNIF